MARKIIILIEDDGEQRYPFDEFLDPRFRRSVGQRQRTMCAECARKLAAGETAVCGCVMPGDGPVCSVVTQDVVVGVGKVSENAGFDAVSGARTQDVVFDGGYRTLMGVVS